MRSAVNWPTASRCFFAWFERQIPSMFSKAYRWVAEMEEVAEFVAGDAAAQELFIGSAHLYERLAADFAGAKEESGQLACFLKSPSSDFQRGPWNCSASLYRFRGHRLRNRGRLNRPTSKMKMIMTQHHGWTALVMAAAIFLGARVDAAPNGETYKTRLSVVPLDVAMQATVAGQGAVTATLAGNKLTVNGTAEGLRSPATAAHIPSWRARNTWARDSRSDCDDTRPRRRSAHDRSHAPDGRGS